jgi:hypothetical protein
MRASYFAAGVLLMTGLLAAGIYSSVAGIRPAAAADIKHEFAVHGIGALSCGDMNTALLKGDAGIRDTLAM